MSAFVEQDYGRAAMSAATVAATQHAAATATKDGCSRCVALRPTRSSKPYSATATTTATTATGADGQRSDGGIRVESTTSTVAATTGPRATALPAIRCGCTTMGTTVSAVIAARIRAASAPSPPAPAIARIEREGARRA